MAVYVADVGRPDYEAEWLFAPEPITNRSETEQHKLKTTRYRHTVPGCARFWTASVH